jgi:hypothetical protein
MRTSTRKKRSVADSAETAHSPGPHLSGSNLAHAGDHNQRVTLHAVRVNGQVTRTELAIKTGLTPADRLAVSLNKRMAEFAGQLPAKAPVVRALTSDDAPAVGAAILPFSYRLLPTRFALLKTT